MDIGQLEAFLRVAAEGSVTRAAILMNKSQSTISVRIANLERYLGTRVFEQRGRRLELTSAGQALLPIAEQMLEFRQMGTELARAANTEAWSRVSVGANNVTASYLATTIARAHFATAPRVRLEIHVHSSQTLTSLLLEGRIDVAFVNPLLTTQVLRQLTSYHDRSALVRSAAFRMNGQLADNPFLSYSLGPVKEAMRLLELAIGHRITVAVESNSSSLIHTLAMEGMGLAILPVSLIGSSLATGELKEVHVPGFNAPDWPVSFVAAPSRHFRAETRAFIDLVTETVKDL
jgi:DNA-binding transcriptional LysR family regulator